MTTYRDIKRIGKGSNGDVWECTRVSDGQTFAKKKLYPGTDEEGVERFRREVRIQSTLDHPNVVQVVGKHLNEAPFWYVMPIYATSLAAELQGVIGDEDRIQPIIRGILTGVEYAHKEGVIHRDLKPANVLLNSDTDLVLTDFGVGRDLTSDSTRDTRSGFQLGTYLYMAPEQYLNAKDADARSDIFSIGRIIYELYTGPLTPATQDLSRLPPQISVIVNRCTQQNPDDRFQTVTELKEAWDAVFEEASEASDYEEIKTLAATLATSRRPTHEVAGRLLNLLVQYHSDGDLIHDTLMKLHGGTIAAFVEVNLGFAHTLVKSFVSHVTSQGWPFSYTDAIGDKCKEWYEKVSDPEIRAELLYCVLKVGVGHNRFHVMETFQEMMYLPKSPGETLAITHRLSKASPKLIEWASNELERDKLDKKLRKFLVSQSGEE